MSVRTRLVLPAELHRRLVAHLLPAGSRVEEAAFVFAVTRTSADGTIFDFLDWLPVKPDGFELRSAHYLELTDATRAGVIKRAHDLGASIVEFHSHPGQDDATFSPSDLAGLKDFVPHVWWRLKGRPYGAVVITPTGFDALAWIESPEAVRPLDEIRVDGVPHYPTGRTLALWEQIHAARQV